MLGKWLTENIFSVQYFKWELKNVTFPCLFTSYHIELKLFGENILFLAETLSFAYKSWLYVLVIQQQKCYQIKKTIIIRVVSS